MTSPLSYWCPKTMESLSNNDGDSNRSGKKSNRLRLAKQQLCTCSVLFVYFLPSGLQRENATFCRGPEHKRTTFFSFPELRYSLLEFNSRKICQHLTDWTRWIKHNKVWSRASSLFKWCFCSRRLPCCLSSLMKQPLCWCRKPALLEWNLFVMD